MPKDEFDLDDPMELSGVALLTEEDTTEAMAECFIEEYMRLGYNQQQVLALFHNPSYLGMNMVLQNRGEDFIRTRIIEIFTRWGRPWIRPTNRHQSEAGVAAPLPPAGGFSRPGTPDPTRAVAQPSPAASPSGVPPQVMQRIEHETVACQPELTDPL